jgi:LysR substrate binding domain
VIGSVPSSAVTADHDALGTSVDARRVRIDVELAVRDRRSIRGLAWQDLPTATAIISEHASANLAGWCLPSGANVAQGVRQVTTEDRAVDTVEEGYDLVIRENPAPDQGLVGDVFLRDRLVIVASPSLAPPRRKLSVPAVVRATSDQPAAWDMKTAKGRLSLTIVPVLCLSSLIMVRDAVRMGVGIGRLLISLVRHDLVAAGTAEELAAFIGK